jgi:hypothetical protein
MLRQILDVENKKMKVVEYNKWEIFFAVCVGKTS